MVKEKEFRKRKLCCTFLLCFSILGGEPAYPDKVRIQNLNDEKKNWEEIVGDYTKVDGEDFNHRPVWQKKSGNKRYIFSNGKKDSIRNAIE